LTIAAIWDELLAGYRAVKEILPTINQHSSERKNMKALTLFAVAVMVAVFVPIKAAAGSGGGLILTVAATIKSQGTNSTFLKGTESSLSMNEKVVYTLISNAVADANGHLGPNLTPAILPADGYIAYNGSFYVTNKSGFFFPLSGTDATNGTYSFIEFTTYVTFSPNPGGFPIGYGDFNNDISSYNISSSSTNGTGTATSTGILFIHDNPYVLDDWDNPDHFFGSSGHSDSNAIEIRGIVTTQLKYTDSFSPALTSFSVTGTGNAILNGREYFSLVTSGKATLSP
jgi:hypothetical protein